MICLLKSQSFTEEVLAKLPSGEEGVEIVAASEKSDVKTVGQRMLVMAKQLKNALVFWLQFWLSLL